MDAARLLLFAGIVQLGVVSPGPDFAITVRNTVISGRRMGMVTALGIATGIVVWSLGAALGVAALLAASARAYLVVKLIGAAYLLFLGVKAVRSALRGEYTAAVGGGGERTAPRLGTGFRQGLLCNVLNPKVAAFYMALIPQFLPPAPQVVDVLALSAISVTLTGVWFVLVAAVVGALRRVLERPAVRRRIDAVTGFVLMGLGFKLASS